MSDDHGQPTARATDDLSAFLDGLATSWQNLYPPGAEKGSHQTRRSRWSWRRNYLIQLLFPCSLLLLREGAVSNDITGGDSHDY